MHRERHRGRRQDLATDRQHAVREADGLLEVAALDLGHRREQDVADGMPAERAAVLRARIGRRAGEAMLEHLAHERLVVGEGREAAPDVADRRDRQLVAQHARRSAVVGDRDDRGQVARVLLEAAQERRLAGPAADDDDARPAGERLPLVDQLDQPAALRRDERVGQRADRPVGAVADQGRAGQEDEQPAAAGTAGTGASRRR